MLIIIIYDNFYANFRHKRLKSDGSASLFQVKNNFAMLIEIDGAYFRYFRFCYCHIMLFRIRALFQNIYLFQNYLIVGALFDSFIYSIKQIKLSKY